MLISKFVIVLVFVLFSGFLGLIPALVLNLSKVETIVSVGGFAVFGLLAGSYQISYRAQRFIHIDSQRRNRKRELGFWVLALLVCITVLYIETSLD
jgi:hypothetical protein